jgi:hypothetical protein
MSQPFSRYLHPFDVAKHPALEPEVKRAILASWASDFHAVENQPAMRKPPELAKQIHVDEVFAALRSIDPPTQSSALQ